ncbi:serine protease [Streptomyces sp. BPTC-684]|uniref:serine protease n=1 Tax=Streptomyces sp. BPTC-684 TaxID=3043734 RepID=UPI0024B0BF62|nr:serine protease [Streptomyces sp. BPTC-684]WHM37357.1 NACHT domain-containing protein [Streptomyces sp. BPTC-684]
MSDFQGSRHVVAVFGAMQGTGVLIGSGLVLTCAHLGLDAEVTVAVPWLRGKTTCHVVWQDADLDAALLSSGSGWRQIAQLAGARLGAVATERPLPYCEIIGFPDVQRYDGGRLELDQLTGTVLPVAGRLRQKLTFEFDRPPATERRDGTSPLAGLSGAPVFAGGTVVGLVKEVPRGRGHRRVECVPVAALVANDGFTTWCADHDAPVTPLPEVTAEYGDDIAYEEEYAKALRAQYRRTRIFGLDELNRHDAEWDLDTAYLSLEAQAKGPGTPGLPDAGAPQRIDALLASRPRVLLRGEAGAGKTTLVWWLAAHAAAGTLGPQLADLNGLVPFVVPLRTLRAQGGAYPKPSELPYAARLVVDDAPDGWAARVLKTGRAMLLVDGLDEVPQDDREEAHRWLSNLLERYPQVRCVATVRPLAVEPGWLRRAAFEELRLLPMRDEDIQAFVAAWHRAARLDSDPHEPLDELERDLAHQFRTNAALAALARTPLLCAVICALHRLRQGFLPKTRWDLYQSALRMLLGNRDERRKVGAPERITLTVEESTQLLQRIAVWLVREGQTEFTAEQARLRILRALPGMPRVREQGTPELVLRHLLNRSGLLQERGSDVYQFTHRTFQDFLAAKELVEDDHIKELVQHATEEQWQDVILLAAGHCGRGQLPELVNGLLKAGGKRAPEVHVLAALCAQHAAWLDEQTSERVKRSIAALLPPTGSHTIALLSRLGPALLTQLPMPDDLGIDSSGAGGIAALISRIGGAEAIPYARAWASHGHRAADQFASTWDRYPTAAYAREVLSQISWADIPLRVTSKDQLDELRALPAVQEAVIVGDFTAEELAGPLDNLSLRTVSVVSNDALSSLSFLHGVHGLRRLAVDRCSVLEDFSALTGLTALESLYLGGMGADGLAAVSVHTGVRHLHMGVMGDPSGLDAWQGLSHFSVQGASDPAGLLAQVARMPRLTSLDLKVGIPRELLSGPPCPQIRTVRLDVSNTVVDYRHLPRVFPALETLRLTSLTRPQLSREERKNLRTLPGVTVTVNGRPL